MAGSIGSVSITVDADATDVPSQVEKATKGPLSKVGATMGRALSAGLNAAIDPSAAGQKIGASIQSGAQVAQAALGRLGAAALQTFPPIVQEVGNFAAGFASSKAAASALTGQMGSLGGAARAALQPAITGVQNFVSGFGDARAAISSFTGPMGALGGVARTAWNAASTAAQGFATAGKAVLSAVGTAASATWEAMKRGASAAFSAIGSTMKTTLEASARLAGAGVAAVLGTSLVKGFSRLESIDTAEAKLTGLGITGDNLSSVMDSATKAVTGTAFGLGEAASAAASFSAAGVPIDGMERSLSILASTAAVGGSSLTEMGTIFGKVAATGKLNGEVLQQLAERGVPALSLVADQLGVTAEEASKMVSSGEVDFETFQSAMEAGLGPAAQAMGQSFSGMMANVGAALGRAGAAAQKPIFDSLKLVLPGVIALFGQITEVITPVAEIIASKLEPAAAALGAMLEKVDFTATSDGASSFLSALGPLLPVIGGLLGLLGPMLGSLPVIGPLFAGISGPVGLLAGALVALIALKPETLLAGFESLTASLPGMIQGIVDKASELLPQMVARIAENLPIFINGILGLLTAVIPVIIGAIPTLVDAFAQLIPTLVDLLIGGIPAILDGALAMFDGIVQALLVALPLVIASLVAMLPKVAAALVAALPQIVTSALGLFMGILQALVQATPIIIAALMAILPVLLQSLLDMLPTIIQGALDLFLGIVTGLLTALPMIITALVEMLPELLTTLVDMIPELIGGAVQLFTGLVEAIPVILPQLVEAIAGLIPVMVETLVALIPDLVQAGIDLIGGLLEGLAQSAESVGEALLQIAKDAIGGFLSFLGIKSPSRLFAGFGGNVVDGLIKGLEDSAGVDKAMDGLANQVGSGFAGPTITPVAATSGPLSSGVPSVTTSASSATATAGEPGIVQNYEITANNVDPIAVGAAIADRSNFNLARVA